MLDYKKILETENWDDAVLDIGQTNKYVDIGGTKKGLLYLACKLAEFVEEDCSIGENAEINFDIGEFTTEDSCHLCVYLCDKLSKSKENNCKR